MNNLKKKIILQIANIITPIICFSFLGIITLLYGGDGGIFGSNEEKSLIDPIGFSFSIWGIIFIFIGIFLIYQARDLFKSPEKKFKMDFIYQVSIFFILSTIFTTFWYIAFILKIIWLSTLFMIFYLISLIFGYLRLKINKIERNKIKTITIVIPWSLYTAWVTAASIVSITSFFENIGFNNPPFLLSDIYWGVLILLMTLGIYLAVLLTRDDYVFSLVGIWVLIGIISQRLVATPLVLEIFITAVIGVIILSVTTIWKIYSLYSS